VDSIFFWASKLIWILASPGSVLVIWITIATVLLLRDKIAAAKKNFAIIAIALVTLGFLPIGQWLIIPLENRFATNPPLPDKVDGIVVLSGSEIARLSDHWQQVELNGAGERNFTFMKLARRYPDAQLVYTGGSPSLLNQQYKEADVAKQLYRELGLDVSRIQFERNARNTAENAALSYKMVNPGQDENWLLITTAWHMPRSYGLFCQVGWRVLPYPVDHQVIPGQMQFQWAFVKNLYDLNVAVKEWVGLTVYYLLGKTSAFLPSDCAVKG